MSIVKIVKQLTPEFIKQLYRRSIKVPYIYTSRNHYYPSQEFVHLNDAQPERDDLPAIYAYAEKEFGILQIQHEIFSLARYVAQFNPKIIGEIGLKFSGNSFLFCQYFQHAVFYLGMDLKLNNIAKLVNLANTIPDFHFLEGSSYDKHTIIKTGSILDKRQFDFLFIDGDHSYDGVVNDLLSYYEMVRDGGLIAFHDIVPDELARFGKKTPGSLCYGGDVYKLWNKVKPLFKHQEFIDNKDQYGFGIGVIHVDRSISIRDLKQAIYAC